MNPINADHNFEQLNIQLPSAPKPIGVYKPFLIVGNQIFVSGHGPMQSNGNFIIGRVGLDMTVDEAKQAAQQVGLAILATLKANLGSFNRIKRVIKVFGMVNVSADFERHPYVINGCSELFAHVWGEENGVGVRSAVGVSSLPDNIPVEIEAVFELRE